MKKSKIFLNALLATSSIGLVTTPILTLASCSNNNSRKSKWIITKHISSFL